MQFRYTVGEGTWRFDLKTWDLVSKSIHDCFIQHTKAYVESMVSVPTRVEQD
jgi:hypothetical protein